MQIWTELGTGREPYYNRSVVELTASGILLVSTYVVCERLSVMQRQARLPEFFVQNSLSASTQVFQECWHEPPPQENADLDRSWHFGFWSEAPLSLGELICGD